MTSPIVIDNADLLLALKRREEKIKAFASHALECAYCGEIRPSEFTEKNSYVCKKCLQTDGGH